MESNRKTVARWRGCWGGWRRKGVGEGDGFVDGGRERLTGETGGGHQRSTLPGLRVLPGPCHGRA